MQNKSFLLRLLTIVFLTGAGALTLLAVFRFIGPIPLSISSTVSQKQNLFTSTGYAEIETIPDQAEVSLGINVNQATVALAQDEANQVMNAITSELTSMGVEEEDIKTQNYSIYPEYNYNSDQREIIGYQVRADLLVKVTDFDRLNTIIDMATAQGANQVGGINFSLSNEREDELKKQAREEAIADAKESADELSRLSGVNLGRVVDVQESKTGSYPMPYMARTEMMAMDAAGGSMENTSVQPGSATYSYMVTLSYETR